MRLFYSSRAKVEDSQISAKFGPESFFTEAQLSQAKLKFLIFCQSQAVSLNGEKFRDTIQLSGQLPKCYPPKPDELGTSFFTPHLRIADVPLAFHRGSVFDPMSTPLRSIAEISERLDTYSRMIQYMFDDGLILSAHEILYHQRAKFIPRHLLPLLINVHGEWLERSPYTLESGMPPMQTRPSWQTQADKVILSVLLGAQRMLKARSRVSESDFSGPEAIYLTFNDRTTEERAALKLASIELLPPTWGPWRLKTDLLDPQTGVHYGRARLELDAKKIGNLDLISHSFVFDPGAKTLSFHTFDDQLARLRVQIPRLPAIDGTDAKDTSPSRSSIHLTGHALIQNTVQEVNEILATENASLTIEPGSSVVPKENVRPQLLISGDGSVRFMTKIETEFGSWEVHGLPQSSAYLLLNLQLGLGATTGYANTQLAHGRRGMKRERDMKVLRNLGFSSLIFFDAAQFALGLPLSNGMIAKTEEDVCQSIFDRLGAIILKTEGWPTQTGSLTELCSKNVTTLIEGFVRQVVRDLRDDPADNRFVHVYLPQGEFKIAGLIRAVALFFHAIVADLASDTRGVCFTRARTKYFENFMNGRPSIEREDLAIRREVDREQATRMIYQPGIGERYILPDSSRPPHGTNLFLLLGRGFELFIDGRQIEEFAASDFKPEFNLREATEEPSDAIAVGAHKINWFELSPKFFFKGVEITGEQATRLSKEGMIEFQGRLYRVRPNELPSLKRLTQFWSTIQSGSSGLTRGKRRRTEDTYYQLPRSQTLELLALRASGVKVRGGQRWDDITKFYDSLHLSRPMFTPPPSFRTKLQPYQTIGVQWLKDLYQLGLGGILADDMGLGKTVTTLAFLEALRVDERMGPCLVLVPTSLTYNWLSEAERFTPEIPTHIFNGRDSEGMLDFIQAKREGLVICTYGLLQEHAELFQQVEWNIIIFDEAQNLKNITTKRTTAARKMRGSFRLCLTGTPLENHYGEFYSLFDLIVPGSLGELPDFREKYVNPVRVLREDIDYLRLKAKPLLMRRTKAQVMSELPPKVETTLKLPFEEEQKRIYRDIATSYNEQIRSQIALHGEKKMQLQMLTALLRLRQACSDPSAIPGVKYTGEPPKIATLVEALQEITEGGASALVFTQFLATFERIRQKLSLAKIQHFDISGADSRLSREKKLKAFQNEEAGAVMLMTLKTGGVGLNLTKANYVFHIEPWWNPAVENQATDRAHRIGQLETVQVYRYLIKESVEEKIEVLKDIKSKRFDALFASTENESELGPSGTALTQQDFEFLLS